MQEFSSQSFAYRIMIDDINNFLRNIKAQKLFFDQTNMHAGFELNKCSGVGAVAAMAAAGFQKSKTDIL